MYLSLCHVSCHYPDSTCQASQQETPEFVFIVLLSFISQMGTISHQVLQILPWQGLLESRFSISPAVRVASALSCV